VKIVSVIPEIFQEWPSEISLGMCVFQCCFRCPWCSMKNIIYDSSKIIGTFNEVYQKHKNPMHTAVVISGGEPTIWGDKLLEAARTVKADGLKLKIFSNGFNYSEIRKLNAEKLVDAYSIDFKGVDNLKRGIGVDIADGTYLWHFWKTINLILEKNIDLEIRVTKYPGLDTDLVKSALMRIFPEVVVHYQDYVEYTEVE
jgi:pyruvate-formate lyase-activating enzyme